MSAVTDEDTPEWEEITTLLYNPADLEWQEKALCREVDWDMFFPERGGTTVDAKTVCGACEVRAECLQYALDNGERFGVWGGLSERERRLLKSFDGSSELATTQQASTFLGVSRSVKKLRELGLVPISNGPGDMVLWDWDAIRALDDVA